MGLIIANIAFRELTVKKYIFLNITIWFVALNFATYKTSEYIEHFRCVKFQIRPAFGKMGN